MSYRDSHYLVLLSSFRKPFPGGSQVGVFAFQAAQLIFQKILEVWAKILQLATRCHQMPGKNWLRPEIKGVCSFLLDKKTPNV